MTQIIFERELNYLLIFLETQDFHLTKEIGMIPKYFHDLYSYKGKVLTHKNGIYPSLEKYCKGINLNFVKKSHHKRIFKKTEFSVLKYLIINALRIDILNLIHLTSANLIYAVLYKLINRKGFVYFKMDTDQLAIERTDLYFWHKYAKSDFKGLFDFLYFQIKKKINTIFLKIVDLISFETKGTCNFFIEKYPKLENKVIYIPNGIDDYFINKQGIKRTPYHEKENVILTVGRIGAPWKCHELILKTISKIEDLKDWKMIFVGPIHNPFKETIQKFYYNHPNLKDVVLFVGEIKDRKNLISFYQRSKVFCLTSERESFGIVLVESGYFGNFIVCSDLPSTREIINDGKYGYLFKSGDFIDLAKILNFLINNERIIEDNYSKIINHIEKKFLWSKIVKKLRREIVERKN